MDRISDFNFSYEKIGFNNFRCFITNLQDKTKFFINFENHHQFQANEDTNKQIFAEFIKNAKNFIIDAESELIKDNSEKEIIKEENKVLD